MRPQSCKAKGRRLQQLGRDLYLASFPCLEPDDITSRSMGAGGSDLLLSPAAKKLIPFDHEFKNQENIGIWAALLQAEKNTTAGRKPLLVFSRNHSPVYAALFFDDLLNLVKRAASIDHCSCAYAPNLCRLHATA